MNRQANSIPFHQPWIGEEEIQSVVKALRDGCLVGNGVICKRVEQQMQEMFDVKHVLLTTSCTHAMEMAAMALDLGPGDEVILPSFTFSSTANAVVLRGARPVFAEICVDTLNLDPDDVRRRITSRTKAIMPVHYAGVGCEMDALMEIAQEYGLHVIEDAAQGVDAKYKGRFLGTIGHIGCYSFHATKNITCGEGGAFLTNDDNIACKAEIIREKGTNRSAFLRGEVDKYSWVGLGSSYVLSDLLASILEKQLMKRKEIKSRRKRLWERYHQMLVTLATDGLLSLPVIPSDRESNYHIFHFFVQNSDVRENVLEALHANAINATFHYVPLDSSPFAQSNLGYESDLKLTKSSSRTLVRLPLYPKLNLADVDRIIDLLAATLRRKVKPHPSPIDV